MTAASENMGEFSFTATSFTVVLGQPGTVQVQANFEGSYGDFGLTLGTMSLSRNGPTRGTWTCCITNFPETGDGMTGTALGSVSKRGANRWHTQGLLTLSDGRECRVDGELNLAGRSWRGQLLPRKDP